MPNYCVPLENTALAASHPNRWCVLEYDQRTAQDAVQCAVLDFPGKHMIVWAASCELPSFDELRALRAGYDRLASNRKRRA